MTNITEVDKIKVLREETGLSFAEIKKALTASNGDMEKAKAVLGDLGAAMAAKKSERQVKEGLVECYIHTNKKSGAMVQLMCETDFVARNDDFKILAKDISMHILAMKPASVDELLSQPFVKDPALTVKEVINKVIAKIGENIQVGQFAVYEL